MKSICTISSLDVGMLTYHGGPKHDMLVAFKFPRVLDVLYLQFLCTHISRRIFFSVLLFSLNNNAKIVADIFRNSPGAHE